MIDIIQLREELIRPTLQSIRLWSLSAENLLVGTGLVESNFKYIKQKGGIALSFWQIEPATYTYLTHRVTHDREIRAVILNALDAVEIPTDENQLLGNMTLAIIVARLKYWYIPENLPEHDDIEGLSRYWGKYYQTESKPKAMDRFVNLYAKYGEHPVC